MASRRPTHNFVTSPSGLLVPEVTDDAVNDRTDITFDIAPATSDGYVLQTEGGEVVWGPGGGAGGGVDSIEADGGGALTGDVTFSEGSNITLTTAGNDIEIAAAGGGGVTEVANVTFTSQVDISATVEASGDTVVSSGAITYTADQHKIEFYSPWERMFGASAANSITMIVNLWDGASNLCRIGMVSTYDAGSGNGAPFYCCRYLTPSAGSHTYIIKAWVSGTSASGQFGAGNGGSSSTLVPGFIRITKGG